MVILTRFRLECHRGSIRYTSTVMIVGVLKTVWAIIWF